MCRDAQTYTLAELPRGKSRGRDCRKRLHWRQVDCGGADLTAGKYIVCGEAMQEDSGQMIQSSCFETQINRKDDNSEYLLCPFPGVILIDHPPGLQNGVKAMIVIAFVIVALVVIYAILYQVWGLF